MFKFLTTADGNISVPEESDYGILNVDIRAIVALPPFKLPHSRCWCFGVLLGATPLASAVSTPMSEPIERADDDAG